MDNERIMRIIDKYREEPGGLLSIMQNIQLMYGYLPENILKIVADTTGRSLNDIYSVASFHSSFRLTPPVSSLIDTEHTLELRTYVSETRCHHCNHSLMDPNHLIDRHPSVRITVSFGEETGWFMFSPCFDVFKYESEYPLPRDSEVNFFCPFCHAEFMFSANCPECKAPMVPMVTHDSTITAICSLVTCRKHEEKLPRQSTGSVTRHVKSNV